MNRAIGWLCILALLAACGAGSSNPPTASDNPVTETGEIDPGLRPLIDLAIQDLAARLGVAANEIQVHSAVLVVWPDSSLGCPRPGMEYAQVPEDGSRIELVSGGRTYRYHTGGSRTTPFYCDQPLG